MPETSMTMVRARRTRRRSIPAVARAMHAKTPGARLVEIAGAGHMSNMEDPAATNGAILSFVAGLP